MVLKKKIHDIMRPGEQHRNISVYPDKETQQSNWRPGVPIPNEKNTQQSPPVNPQSTNTEKSNVPPNLLISKKPNKTPLKGKKDGVYYSSTKNLNKKPIKMVAGIVGVCLIVLGIWVVGEKTYKAKIVLTPIEIDASLDQKFTVYNEPPEGEFGYDVLVLKDKVSDTVIAGEKEYAEMRAKGTLRIYNNVERQQRLLEETRFESPDGLIYKLAKGKDIILPAASGGEPGTLDVVVYADKVGEEYNTEAVDFVIPGWREQNDSRFTTQYAKALSPITGGFVGNKSIISEDDIEKTTNKLKVELEDLLRSQVGKHIQADITFYDKTFFEIGEIQINDINDTEVELIVPGSISLIHFDKDEFESLLAKNSLVESMISDNVRIDNLKDINMTIKTLDAEKLEDTNKITLVISGSPHFVWEPEIERVKDSLKGISVDQFEAIMSADSSIEKGTLDIKPFWRKKVPVDSERIIIEVE